MFVKLSKMLARFASLVGLEGGLVLLAVALLPWQARYISRVGELAGVPWEQGTVSLFATEIIILAALLVHVVRRHPTAERAEAPWYFRLWALLVLFAGLSITWARLPTAAYGIVLLMAALAYCVLQRAIVRH